MDPAYAQRYRDLALRHWWWRARNDQVRDEIARLLQGRRDARILDIGCGDGVLFPFLSAFGDVRGIEPDPLVVSADCPWRERIAMRPFDASYAPDIRFDLILMLDVLEHFPDPDPPLRQIHTLLADDGCLLVTVPAFRTLWTHHDDLNRHFNRFTKATLAAAMSRARLEIVDEWYLFQWLAAAKVIVRARERVAGPSPAEEVPPGGANTVHYRLCAIERRLTGRIMPFGSSLLAVAKRRPITS
jgi:SAM-dependent methyltransferase